MNIVHLAAIALASVVASAGVAATAAAPLLPLTKDDLASALPCSSQFNSGGETRLFAVRSGINYRTGAGLTHCEPGDAAINDFMIGKRALTCGGRTFRLARTGRVQTTPSIEAQSWPATLSVTRGGMSRTMRGTVGFTC